jgi:hypothetical protein
MAVSPDIQQCIRRMDADGAGPTEIAEALGVPLTPGARPFLDRSAQFLMTTALAAR